VSAGARRGVIPALVALVLILALGALAVVGAPRIADAETQGYTELGIDQDGSALVMVLGNRDERTRRYRYEVVTTDRYDAPVGEQVVSAGSLTIAAGQSRRVPIEAGREWRTRVRLFRSEAGLVERLVGVRTAATP